MNEKDKQSILNIEKIHQNIGKEFTCYLCKTELDIPTCKGCPIYISNFNFN